MTTEEYNTAFDSAVKSLDKTYDPNMEYDEFLAIAMCIDIDALFYVTDKYDKHYWKSEWYRAVEDAIIQRTVLQV